MATSRKKREEILNKGLCIDCRKPRLDSSSATRCEKCNTRNRNSNRKLRQKRLSRKKCRECGEERWHKSTKCKKHCIASIVSRYGYSINDYKLFLELLEKQDYKCHYSGLELIGGDTLSIDHLIPKSRGGTNDISNLVWCHKAVNTFKGTMTEKEFIDFCQKIVDFTLNKKTNFLTDL